MSEPPRSLFRKRPRPQLEAAAAAAPSQALAAPTPAEPPEPPPAKLAQVQAAWPSRPPSRPEASTAASSSDASAQPTAGPALTARDVGFYVRREKVVTNYKEEGICQLFEWQAAALAQPGVLDDGANLVYTAPTSGGKTLVAEMLMLHRLEEGGAHAKAVFVVPYKAIVDEKVRYFERVLKGTKTKVAAYYGGRGTLPVPPKLNVLVCTMEKADVVVQNMATEGRLGELVAAVVDEVHEVGGSRGCCVESLLSKLVCFGRKQKQQREAARLEAAAAAAAADGAGPSGVADTRGPQLIAMSATLPNVEVLGEWDATVYFAISTRVARPQIETGAADRFAFRHGHCCRGGMCGAQGMEVE